MNLPLTISLLASSRIATLERCLDSLKPLLLQVPAELIVVFTGTDERVRQIAKRYTDQVIPFTWCNDFSVARNEGLKRAKGEWFLYLDDDEWFEDVTEICEFFQSGEYRRYRSAAYVNRNYTNWNGTNYTDFMVYRMARRTPDLRFENPIHEELLPCSSPCKMFQAYVHHYGYLKDIQKESTGKTGRNIPLLLEDIAQRPAYTKNYLQLTQEYFSENDFENAEKICRQGRKICSEEEVLYKGWLQSYLVEILYKRHACKQAKEEAVSILEKEQPVELTRLILYSLLVGVCTETKEYKELLEYGTAFQQLLQDMEKHPELWTRQRLGTMNRDKVMNPEWLYPVRLNCIKAALEQEQPQKAAYFLKLLPWEEEYRMQQYYPLLDQWKETYAPCMADLLLQLPYDSHYLLLQRLLCQNKAEQMDEASQLFLFRRCLKEIEQPYLQQQLVKIGLLEEKDFSILLERMDLDTWQLCVKELVTTISYAKNSILWEASHKLFQGWPLHRLWLERLLWEKELMRGFPMKQKLLEALEAYAKCIQSFYQELYQDTMFDARFHSLLPADCRMALAVLEALEDWKQGKLADTLRLFRTALKIYPQMTGVVREVLRLLKNEIDRPAPAAGPEFEQLAAQMKAALSAMLQAGPYQEATSVLTQLLPLLPNDMELLKIQQQLLSLL